MAETLQDWLTLHRAKDREGKFTFVLDPDIYGTAGTLHAGDGSKASFSIFSNCIMFFKAEDKQPEDKAQAETPPKDPESK